MPINIVLRGKILQFMKQENVAVIEEHSENKYLDFKRKGEGIKDKEENEERKEEDRGKGKKGETTKAKSSKRDYSWRNKYNRKYRRQKQKKGEKKP